MQSPIRTLKFEISDECKKSGDQCKHIVSSNGNNVLMKSSDIIDLCIRNRRIIPKHFEPVSNHAFVVKEIISAIEDKRRGKKLLSVSDSDIRIALYDVQKNYK